MKAPNIPFTLVQKLSTIIVAKKNAKKIKVHKMNGCVKYRCEGVLQV